MQLPQAARHLLHAAQLGRSHGGQFASALADDGLLAGIEGLHAPLVALGMLHRLTDVPALGRVVVDSGPGGLEVGHRMQGSGERTYGECRS